jgi:protease PrsW
MLAARQWSWLAVLAVGAGLWEAVRGALVDTKNPNLLPALILLGASVIPAAFVFFIWSRRLDYGVTGGTLAAVAFIGGVVGIVIAGVLEYSTLRHLGVLPLVAVAVIEEAAKLIAPAAVLIFGRHRRLSDGLLVGVAAGAGFAVLETMGYAFVELIKSGGSIAAVDGTLLFRGVLSPGAHMAWTGLTAAALWRATTAPSGQPTRLHGARFVGVFIVAVALHTAWDSLDSIPAFIVLAVVSLGLLAITTHRLAVVQRAAPPPQHSQPARPGLWP